MKQVHTYPGFVLREYVRCPDCDIRGDLDATGRRRHQRHARIKRCSNCEGKSELKLYGTERVDLYAKGLRDPKAIHYALKRANTAWTQRNRFRKQPPRWLVQAVEQPEKRNHGRTRKYGRWFSLSATERDAHASGLYVDAFKAFPRMQAKFGKPPETIRHGTLGAYTNDRCRCEDCRAAMASWKRLRRAA